MGGVLLRADNADVTSSGVRVLETQLRLSAGKRHFVSETDQTSFIYRAENKPTVPTGFAVGCKWTLIAADLQRSQSSCTLGKYQPDWPDLFLCQPLPITTGQLCMCNVGMFVHIYVCVCVCVLNAKLCSKSNCVNIQTTLS